MCLWFYVKYFLSEYENKTHSNFWIFFHEDTSLYNKWFVYYSLNSYDVYSLSNTVHFFVRNFKANYYVL